MEDKATQISDRLLAYGVTIIKICRELNKTEIGRHIGNQLLRAATSVGANYEEARGAQSRADFIHKLQIVLKEIRESMYWLRLVERSDILSSEEIKEATNETQQISAIIGRSIITAKKRK
ncbi:four helix bundle protein [Dehalococcoidia bacterium]|nr:four helix bundle protein [Dehalococcoidia bacterium]MCL0087982.1 four helix bundle protein [Dehalococcoidia bacterium]MCL0088957.1 four helix bundle protein [Dehalococcoidia bacterium]MCL0097880.1 four helix bundle protein [Dehalococcoidia bacterium]